MDSAMPKGRQIKPVKTEDSMSSSSDLEEDVMEDVISNVPTKLPQLPQPLPIYDGAINDSRINAGFRRATKIFNEPIKNITNICEHDDVTDWVCNGCKRQMPQFECFLDDNQGKVGQNFRICFENQFLKDFLTEQTNQLVESDSSEQEMDPDAKNASPLPKEDRSNPEIIYIQYEPRNVVELREYMLFCISRQLQELESWTKEKQEMAIKHRLEMKAELERRNEQLRQQIEREKSAAQNADLIDIVDSSPYPGIKQSSNDFSATLISLKEKEEESKGDPEKQYFVPFFLSDRIGSGKMKNLSNRLTRFLQDLLSRHANLVKKHKGNVLLFDSVFESGNLLRADRLTSREYRLYMQVDTNTKGHQQWFYFRVRNTIKNQTFKFMIMNFTKPGMTGGSGFRKNELMQRIMYKSKKSRVDEWQTIGNEKLEYQKTRVQRRKKDALACGDDSDQDDWVEEAFGNDQNMANGTGQQNNETGVSTAQKEAMASLKKKKVFYYYALVFNVTFEHDDDIVYFAFSQPYPYTQIISEILEREEDLQCKVVSPEKKMDNRQGLDQTETQDATDQAPNANPQSDEQEMPSPTKPESKQKEGKNGPTVAFENKLNCLYYKRQELCRTIGGLPVWMITISRDAKKDKKKQVIVITSRVHSGETPASIVFKGALDFLTGDSKEAKFLRKFYTFVLIPCLNPDGVVCGNYRNCIVGVDLNRQWIDPDKDFQPEIYHTKQMFRNITEVEKRQIWIYCDIHGHSKKQNAFFYGCNTAANGGFLSWTIVRLLPRIFAQKSHLFNIKDCRFKVEPYKIGTGRVVAWKQFQVTHSFTLENSFYGYDHGEDEVVQFTEENYRNVGAKFAESIYEMHFVWKQIRRELQITNGWLKPRVLFDATGVPAAQLLSEELEKKKKAEQRQVAIEQYQMFLKKFYNGKSAPQTKLSSKANAIFESNQLPIQSMLSQNTVAINSTIPLNIYNKQNVGIVQAQKTSKFAQGRGLDKIGNSVDNVELNINNNPMQASQFRQNPRRNQFNNDLDGGQTEEDEPIDFMEKALIGLVKIQARIRGIFARKRVENLILLQRKREGISIDGIKQKPRFGREISSSIQKNANSNSFLQTFNSQRSGEPLRSVSFNEKKQKTSENSLDSELLSNLRVNNPNPLHESKDTLSCSHLERMSSRRMNLLTKDWRLYFQEKELDNAFQVVEIEKREISEEGSSAGSSSNPSEDNLEAEEIYEKVYKLPPQKRLEMIQTKKDLEQKFKSQVKDQKNFQNLLYSNVKEENGKDKNAARNFQTSATTRRGTLKFYRGFNNKTNSGSNIYQNNGLAPSQGNALSDLAQQKNGDGNKGISPYYQYNQNNQVGQGGVMASQGLIQRNSSAHSPMNAFEQHFSMQDYNLSTKNISFNQINGRGLQIQKYQQRDNGKNRAVTSHTTVNGSINHQNLMQSTQYQNNVSQNNHNQMRLFNLNYKAALGKRENINQVIKDCFITKKCGVKKPAMPTMQQIQQNPRQFQQTQSQGVYDIQQQVLNRRNLINSEQSKAMNKQQNDFNFKTSTNYYSNVASSGKKARRIKRNKSPINSAQATNQTMYMHLPNENLFSNSKPSQAPMFMHPQYPQFTYVQNTAAMPTYATQDQKMQQYVHLTKMGAQVKANISLTVQNQQSSQRQMREQAPQKGQVIRVQIAGKQPGINAGLPLRNNVAQIKHEHIQLPVENQQIRYQYMQGPVQGEESLHLRKSQPQKTHSNVNLPIRSSPSQSLNRFPHGTPKQDLDMNDNYNNIHLSTSHK